jgi:RNA polymerase sigma factor (sigma-70 family)
MLGSISEAEDAVQETWLRLSRSDTSSVENLGGWLTTVVGRVCLDMLRSRRSRRDGPLGVQVPDRIVSHGDGIDPEREALLADSVGLALLVVLDTLNPAERLAFVLHDMFGVPFEEIAPIVGRSPSAARQLASRARRRVQGATNVPDTDLTRQREGVDALVAVLDPDVVLRSDLSAAHAVGSREVRGGPAVARTAAKGRARAARPALVNGTVGVVVAPRGRLLMVLAFTIRGQNIVEIDAIADPARLSRLDVVLLGD